MPSQEQPQVRYEITWHVEPIQRAELLMSLKVRSTAQRVELMEMLAGQGA